MNVVAFSYKSKPTRLIKQTIGMILAGSLLLPNTAMAWEQETELPFSDITKHWAKNAIVDGFENGLFTAKSKTSRFEPERKMTRAEFLVVLDRFSLRVEHQLFPLSLLSGYDEEGWGEGFDEPYLPYTDVNRMSAVYPSVLRVSLLLDRLAGPGSIQRIFPGKEMKPQQPISREEAAQVLQMFALQLEPKNAWETVKEFNWFGGNKSDLLKRGEAAVIFQRLQNYFAEDPLLPLLDYNSNKFPRVPEIEELFPLMADFGSEPTPEQQEYIDIVEEIRSHEDTEDTYIRLQGLKSKLQSKLGIHYYLSWNPDTAVETNLQEAYQALDAYFAEQTKTNGVLQLLLANIYDLTLQIGADQPSFFESTVQRLSKYQQENELSQEQQQTFHLYLAAMEARAGHTGKAVERYKKITDNKEALLNLLYYLYVEGRQEEAEKLLEENKAKFSADSGRALFYRLMTDEFAALDRQAEYAAALAKTLEIMKTTEGYQAEGESMLGGYLFKYTHHVDNQQQVTHTTGYVNMPEKLVLEKLDMYSDERSGYYYSYDFEENRWQKGKDTTDQYLYDWVDNMAPLERVKDLRARYVKQSLGSIDIITEWIPADTLLKKAGSLPLKEGKIKRVPVFVSKYFIDHKSGKLISKVWRFEELYESKFYLTYAGKEAYTRYEPMHLQIPKEVIEGAVEK